MVDERGDAWEHDPGPAAASGWAALFAETPNYRGLGLAVLGREAFRWHHGPMFYRGRLDGSAKVLVVGQEGAQDESLSHRSFTGGTGARMQHLLRHLGLDRSYLFLNSFVYPIFGQYSDELRPLAQDPRSPIAAHRNRVLDAAVAGGDVRLVIAVGQAAKESVATWVGARGGSASPDHLHTATPGSLPAGLRLLGVLHPGSATGGSTAAIRADFQRACDLVRGWLDADPGWLPADPGVERDLGAAYQYRSAAIPHRDLPFGTCPRLGHGATTSNRTDAQRGIRLFSAHGDYNAAGAQLQDPATAAGSRTGYASDPGDLPYEPPRAAPDTFDPGPPSDLARLLLGLEPGLGWPDFAALGVTSDPSFGAGPVYRGRFRDLSLVVLADQASQDDLFTGRALSGDAGQRLERFLRAAGLTRRYLIVRTLPVDTLDLGPARRAGLADQPQVRAFHRELLRRVRAQNPDVAALLALGPGAQRLAPQVAPAGLEVIGLARAGASGQAASWQAALERLAALGYPRDLADPTFRLGPGRGQVPRSDLPYGTLRWAGTSGDRALRPVDLDLGRPSPDYLKLLVPAWVAGLGPAPLTPAERAAADAL
ncbi:MAG TPA: uracil-DNA glycosylase family protein [Actinomycetes bacterium]|nr:uracil-DNA glycosylase family protein [Actinomycetes bacterium]